MGTITSADAVLTLAVDIVFPAPVQIQGFAVDDIYNIPSVRSVEVMMGVDGVLSGGFVYTQMPQEITLQADSASNDLFDQWWGQMQANRAVYAASGQILLPSLGRKYTQSNGFLTGYTPAPPGRRVLQPRRYEITWQSIASAPA